MTLFGTWLEDTLALQREAYGLNPAALEGEELQEWWRMNTLAANVEMAEALAELPWKPWSQKHTDRLGEYTSSAPYPEERERVVEEVVDALHFVANLLASLEVTDAELNEVYEHKMHVNRQRQKAGY